MGAKQNLRSVCEVHSHSPEEEEKKTHTTIQSKITRIRVDSRRERVPRWLISNIDDDKTRVGRAQRINLYAPTQTQT